MLDERLAHRESAELLRESAEGLLLSRRPSTEAKQLFEAAALLLVRLIASDAVSRTLAEGLLDSLRASGPAPLGSRG